MPPLTEMLARRYDFDLTPHYPLLVTQFLVLGCPMLLGALAGLLVLDDRDQRTLTALRVTPVPVMTYAGYRAGTVVVVTTAYVVPTTWASGLVPARLLPAALLVGVLSGLLATLLALTVATFAGNKVEGMAIMRAAGILVVGLPVLPWFVPGNWQALFAVLPAYWPAKAFWVAAEGGPYLVPLVVGIAYHGLLLWPLTRAFARRQR
ncbi:ABC transporter permease [Streptoalloteichus tenebrarius]|uniref:ABC transporter permease n=1 Tax=Streptoalloteichus tenebrarius (strain ATCC 17920 / DSM 40477 / JCM 4838 / CBS 697.72 / NBRC 16177 / NCIMB 11028 / NRRL B-12390 / A12253. 1 / ISP 5477) TaxID=1933 RepID=UPI0035EE0EF8